MGAMKDWAITQQECPICGKLFIPWENRKHAKNILTVCSEACSIEEREVLEAIAARKNQGGRYDYQKLNSSSGPYPHINDDE